MRLVLRIVSLGIIVGAVLVVTWGNLQNAATTWSPDDVDQNFVAIWEQRLYNIKADIPSDITMIGYIADWDIPGAEWDVIDQTTEYMLTQYAFAPRIIQRGLEHNWLIGNFITSEHLDWLDRNLVDYHITDYGGGIFLIRQGDALP